MAKNQKFHTYLDCFSPIDPNCDPISRNSILEPTLQSYLMTALPTFINSDGEEEQMKLEYTPPPPTFNQVLRTRDNWERWSQQINSTEQQIADRAKKMAFIARTEDYRKCERKLNRLLFKARDLYWAARNMRWARQLEIEFIHKPTEWHVTHLFTNRDDGELEQRTNLPDYRQWEENEGDAPFSKWQPPSKNELIAMFLDAIYAPPLKPPESQVPYPERLIEIIPYESDDSRSV